MEAVTIEEVQNVPGYRRNQMLLLMNVFGICGVDKQYVNDNDSNLNREEAASLVKLLDFDLAQCGAYFWRALLWLLVHGIVFRVVACVGLHYGNRNKKV